MDRSGKVPNHLWISDLWWVPLTWASNLVNKMGPNAAKGESIIPKDHKDVLSSLHKFKISLAGLKTRGDNHLPVFYKKVMIMREMVAEVMTLECSGDPAGCVHLDPGELLLPARLQPLLRLRQLPDPGAPR